LNELFNNAVLSFELSRHLIFIMQRRYFYVAIFPFSFFLSASPMPPVFFSCPAAGRLRLTARSTSR